MGSGGPYGETVGLDEDASCWGGTVMTWRPLYPFKRKGK